MLKTEMRNDASRHIDKMDTISMLNLMNEENMKACRAVEAATTEIAKVCDITAQRMEKGYQNTYQIF